MITLVRRLPLHAYASSHKLVLEENDHSLWLIYCFKLNIVSANQGNIALIHCDLISRLPHPLISSRSIRPSGISSAVTPSSIRISTRKPLSGLGALQGWGQSFLSLGSRTTGNFAGRSSEHSHDQPQSEGLCVFFSLPLISKGPSYLLCIYRIPHT